MDVNEEQLLAWMAEEFYCNGVSQVELSNKMRVSKATVSRMLKKAVRENIIIFEISVPKIMDVSLEREIENTFEIQRAIIVDCKHLYGDDRNGTIGAAVAPIISNFLSNGDIVGLSGGESVNAVVKNLPFDEDKEITVTQLAGVDPMKTLQSSAFFAAEQMAQKYSHCQFYPILLPSITTTRASIDVIKNDLHYEKARDLFKKINVAMLGIGSILGDVPDSALYRNGYISQEELLYLREQGAVGVVLSNFIDKSGKAVESSITERVISMGLEELQKIPHAIFVANGRNKVIPILAALKAGYIDVLVTDSDTAKAVLNTHTQKGCFGND